MLVALVHQSSPFAKTIPFDYVTSAFDKREKFSLNEIPDCEKNFGLGISRQWCVS